MAAIPLGRGSLPGSSDLPGSRNGADRSCSPIWSCSAWGLPCRLALLRPRCALTAPFHPYLTVACPAVLFSVALSVEFALSESPRPLAGMLPYGDRTFLPPVWVAPHQASGCPSGRPAFIMAGRIGEGQSVTDIIRRVLCKSLEMTKHNHAVEYLQGSVYSGDSIRKMQMGIDDWRESFGFRLVHMTPQGFRRR